MNWIWCSNFMLLTRLLEFIIFIVSWFFTSIFFLVFNVLLGRICLFDAVCWGWHDILNCFFGRCMLANIETILGNVSFIVVLIHHLYLVWYLINKCIWADFVTSWGDGISWVRVGTTKGNILSRSFQNDLVSRVNILIRHWQQRLVSSPSCFLLVFCYRKRTFALLLSLLCNNGNVILRIIALLLNQ